MHVRGRLRKASTHQTHSGEALANDSLPPPHAA